MKTFIIAALTADGFIAKNENHAAMWTSKDDKARFVKLTKEAGIVVMGSTTYATLPKALRERRNIVYSRNPDKKFEGAEITQESPADLVRHLSAESPDKNIAVCGGAHIYSLFMKSGVVDKLYLTIEPIIFGDGIRLFSEAQEYKLQLVKSETTPGGTVMLDYDILK